MSDLTPEEQLVLDNLRQIKGKKGHGTLRVDIRDGVEATIRREHGIEVKKGLDNK